MKADDLHSLFYGTTLDLLLLTLPWGSALHTSFCILRKKAKTEMITTRLDYSNNINPCTIEKKGRGRGLRERARRGGIGGAGRGGGLHTTYI